MATVPFAASPGDISYSYARADLAGEAGDGFFGKGSVAMGDSFFAMGGYQEITNSDYGLDVSLNETALGFGYRNALSDKEN